MAQIEIPNLSYKEYIEHPNDESLERFLYVLRYSDEVNNAANVLNLPTLWDCAFGFVKDAQYMQANGGISFANLFELIGRLTDLKDESFGAMKVFDLRKQALWFTAELERINNSEAQLSGRPEADELEADGSELQKLGPYLQFSELASGDVTKIELVKQTPYHVCYLELKRRKLQNDFDRRLFKIRNPKNKNT